MHLELLSLPLAAGSLPLSRIVAITLPALISSFVSAATVDLPRFPALSPDGTILVFSWRGDLWRAAATGGEAVRLTSNTANETRSGFTPDGTRIVFESDREGLKNLWSMRSDGSDLRQLTEIDSTFSLSSVGVLDGKPVAFIDTAMEGDLYRSMRPYVVSIDGGTPVRLHDAFGAAAVSSPDGARVLFERGSSPWSRRGYHGPDNRNVWMYQPATKSFEQLTKYDGNDGVPRFIGADEFVYISDRGNGSLNLHRAKVGAAIDSGARLTDFDGMDIHGVAVALDGTSAVVAVLGDLWRIDLTKEGAVAEKLAFTAADDGLVNREFRAIGRDVDEVALSPDGKTMAFVANGDVFVRATEEKSPTRRVSEGEARERDIAWSADGLSLYFVSDSDGSDSIYAATVAQTRGDVKDQGKDKSKEDAAKDDAAKSDESATPSSDAKDEAKDDAKSDEKDESKDDAKSKKKPAKKDPLFDSARWADAIRFNTKPLTQGGDDDRRPLASPDGTTLLFTRNVGNLARLELATGVVTELVDGWDDEIEYVFSPDSSLIAFAHSDQDFNKDIWLMPADGSKPAVNVTRHPDNDASPRFSADGKILAFLSERTNEEVDAWVVMLDRDLEGLSARDLEQYYKDAAESIKKRKPLETKPPETKAPVIVAPAAAAIEVTPLAVTTEPAAVVATDPAAIPPAQPIATPETPTSSATDPAQAAATTEVVAKPATAAPKKPLFDELELDDAYMRVRRVTTLPGDEGSLLLLPTGDSIVFSATEGKESALFTIKTDGTAQKKITGPTRVFGLNFAGDRVVAIGGGQGQTVSLTGEAKNFDIAATSEIALSKRNAQKLDETSRIMARKFYKSPADKGLDWPALTARYRELATHARTPDEFDFVANMFIGHLDASHLGVRTPDGSSAGAGAGPGNAASSGAARRTQGRLGVTTISAEGGRRVTAVLPNSPAALASPRLEVGDLITAIDFEAVDPSKPLESMLMGKTGQESIVAFTRQGAETTPPTTAQTLNSIIVPMASSQERTLRYTAETLENAAKVTQLSGGRLGYLHIASMDQPSLDRFERDLYAAAHGKDGLIIDVRNNGGGFTADRLLSSIDVRRHAYAIPRDGDLTRTSSYPQDRLFIQRYTMPMAMLANEKSFSNAEIIAHAFKTLGRGPLVGQQTAGGVISTGSESLVDGTSVRMPFRGWYIEGTGKDMEENGAMPDFVVPQTPQDESNNFDAQLARAVTELMKSVPSK